MSRTLVLYENARWAELSPLADLTPVPALAFGASTLGGRWRDFAGVPLLAIEARPETLAPWSDRPACDAAPPQPADEVLVLDAAALPGPWFARALDAPLPAAFTSDGRIVGARLPFATLRPGLACGAGLEAFLGGLGLPAIAVDARVVTWPWQVVEWNVAAIADDLTGQGGRLDGEVDEAAELYEPERIVVDATARVDALAVLDARGGPIWIGAGAVVLSHTVVAGPCVVGAGTELLGGFIGRSTFGPGCRIAGEVDESVWQGWANKRHHGFVGHSVVGEWTNLGALTTTSDLKNNYGHVRVWVAGEARDSGLAKVGSFIGAHVKTGIGTLLPTGASIGVGANLFGGGRFAPKRTPSFGWWDGEGAMEHRLDAMLETARTAMGRRNRVMSPSDEAALRTHFHATAAERGARSARGTAVGAP